MTTWARPSFTVQNRVYVSAGIMFCTSDNHGNIKFLLQCRTDGKKSWEYEDFGGKSAPGDKSILDVAIRECLEEMAPPGQEPPAPFTKEYLRGLVDQDNSVTYPIPEDKYMLYIVHLDGPTAEGLDLDSFGQINDDEVNRRVVWTTYESFMKLDDYLIHPRLIPNDLKVKMPLVLAQIKKYPSSKMF